MKQQIMDKLNAFEMWVWRRMQKVSWKDKKTNEEILSLVGEERCLMKTIIKRKKDWIGHVVRGDNLLKRVLERRMEGKKPQGRPRMGMIDDLKEGSYTEMKRRTDDREMWREHGCQGPAEGQRTNDDDDEQLIYLRDESLSHDILTS